METQAQQQQYENQYQYQTLIPPPISTTTQSINPTTQIQSYDHQSYYSTYPQQHYDSTQQPYSTTYDSSSSYYYPNYPHSYQTLTLDPNSIQPPGVPVSGEIQQTHVVDSQNLYYQPPQFHGYFQPAQPAYGIGDGQGGQPTRGRGRGTFGRHGRGRGRGGGGRGKHVTSQTSAPAAANIEAAAPSKPPPQMAWCELCRVDCNTLEILEKHKNGKKHLRNVKVFEELQNTSKPITVMNPQVSLAQAQPKPEESNLVVNNAEPSQVSDMADKAVPSVAQPSEEAVRSDSIIGRGGLKRKMKKGRGGKWVRTYNGSIVYVEPPKPKQMVPILCELCNVKCESQMVYDSHVAGKKHLATLKRYQGHKETFGEAADALYPAIPNLPSIPVAQQSHVQQQVPQDAEALASLIIGQQNLPNPQAAQAAVAQLLNQHGIHDAQTLLVQLVPYLLTQAQVPGSVPGMPLPITGVGPSDPCMQSQEPCTSTEVERQHDENKTEQQNLADHGGSNAGAGTSEKADDGPSEGGNTGAQ